MPNTSKAPTQTSLNHTLAGGGLKPAHTPDEEEDRAVSLLDLAIALIDQALDVLTLHIKTDTQLKHDSVLLPGGTVGKHFRHVIETYQAFLLALISSHTPSSSSHKQIIEINYDAILPVSRHPVARSLAICRRSMQDVRTGLQEWGDRCKSTPRAPGMGISGETTGGMAGVMRREVNLVAVTPTRQEMRSTVGRELWFCSLHAIHHFSMLRTIAVHELGLKLPVEFGTAPSTLLYREKNFNGSQRRKASPKPVKAKL